MSNAATDTHAGGPAAAAAGTSAVRRIRRGGPGWPERLEHLELPPPCLWLRGAYAPGGPMVAVVGARDATMAGLEVARRLAGDLAVAGIPVVSGMALGIDGAAHQGALDAGGITVGVLGCGIDVPYPRAHGALRERAAIRGALLSEEPPGTWPAPWRFPRRNRIIAALAVAVVVVEATDRSGALSTARHAADLGREVFAVPGPVLSERSAGANRLLRDGATPLTETADLAAVPALAEALDAARARFSLVGSSWRPSRDRAGSSASHPPARSGGTALPPATAAVFRRIGHHPVHPDALAAELRLSPPELAARLADLELAGLLRTVGGGLVVRHEAAPGAPPKAPAQPCPRGIDMVGNVGRTLGQPAGTSGRPLL